MELLEKEIEDSALPRNLVLMGLDEVGRGPLAGPVVSCCCAFDGDYPSLMTVIKENLSLGITDSKKLSAKKRKKILESLGVEVSTLKFNEVYSIEILGSSFHFCLSQVNHNEIDDINILQASLKSMDLAFEKLMDFYNQRRPDIVWVDGNKLPPKIKKLDQAKAIIKGDSRSFIIALSSIIAKEKRDLMMEEFSEMYPGYGFEKHSGYPTKAHKEALLKLGPCPIHRLSFKGVRL
jgi:ribonuclease HII